jgi:hypothetical protein
MDAWVSAGELSSPDTLTSDQAAMNGIQTTGRTPERKGSV